MAVVIDGNKVAEDIKSELKVDIQSLTEKFMRPPGLAVILVGNDPASEIYVNMKKKNCAEIGIKSYEYNLSKDITENELVELIQSLNKNPGVDGILVQLPVPAHINEHKVICAIEPSKDVDGFHPINAGKNVIGLEDGFIPCTPLGCQVLINSAVENTSGKHLVVVGRSNIVGKPLANLMLQKNKNANCIVTVCHSAVKDISIWTRQADILVSAVGKAKTITADMVKPGAVIIDVGTNKIMMDGKSRLVGDVDYEPVSQVASAITPVPGGVGPMTRAMLLHNTVKAFRQNNN